MKQKNFSKEDRAELRARLEALYGTHSNSAIAAILTKEGFKTPRGKRFTKTTIGNYAQDFGLRKYKNEPKTNPQVTRTETMPETDDNMALAEIVIEAKIPTQKKLTLLKYLM